jgi:hypothetical protein
MLFWLRFRLAQVYRLLQDTGWGILLLLIVVTAGLWLRALQGLSVLADWQIGAAAHAGIGFLHLRRADGRFLRQSQRHLPDLLLIDYGLILLPFALFLGLFFRFWAVIGLLTALAWAFAPLRAELRTSDQKVLPLPVISPVAFEWYHIIRSQGLLLLLGILLQLGTGRHFGFFAGGAALVLLTLPAGFDYVGPHTMLPQSSPEFVRRWRALAKVLHLTLLPGYLLMLAFQIKYWWLALYVFGAAEIYLLLCFVFKLHSWQPDRARAYNATVLGLSWMFLLLPGLIVVPLGQGLWFFRKIRQRFFNS